MTPNEQLVYGIANLFLQQKRASGEAITDELLVDEAGKAARAAGDLADFEIDNVIRALQANIAVEVIRGGILTNNENHVEWLTDERVESTEWKFWDRYERYLNTQGLPDAVVKALSTSTLNVLRQLEDPARSDPWNRRGMVVGHVQSGKTGHYTGLICRAADAGYRLIVVLAGSEDNLRAQTQSRLDHGFNGFTGGYGTGETEFGNDRRAKRVGVGEDLKDPRLPVFSITSVEGDFNRQLAERLAVPLGDDTMPIVLVVKKNPSILRNLIRWTRSLAGNKVGDLYEIESPAVLVIDDECDTYSINTKRTRWEFEQGGDLQDPTKINGLIREFLHMFKRAAFVGYTATPFANIFIYHDPSGTPKWEKELYGPDLFPESFIESLDRNTNYVGPDVVFGLNEAEIQGVEGKQGLPIIRISDDISEWIDPKHKKTWSPDGPLPSSLLEAIKAFVLVCAARRARGQGTSHNSMLIHLSRFVHPQALIKDIVDEELGKLQRSIAHHKAEDPRDAVLELKELWESDFATTTGHFKDEYKVLTWAQLEPHLKPAAKKITVKEINGDSDDVLEYDTQRSVGISVIAIGGQQLQRGLTLEGLSVSYFQRSTKMYDTLMQMGRWFGYRDGYLDLCRLYLTTDLKDWYMHIATATEELYASFDVMARLGRTPRDFGLKVATHSGGLLVTGAAKLRNGEKVRLNFGGDTMSTRSLQQSDVERNRESVEELISSLGEPMHDKVRGAKYWEDVSASQIIRLAEKFAIDETAIVGRGMSEVKEFIRSCAAIGQLTNWTVAVATLRAAGNSVTIGGIEARTATRSGHDSAEKKWTFNTLVDPKHEGIGLPDEAVEELEKTRVAEGREIISGAAYRHKRDVTNGLLIIYPLVSPKDWGEYTPALAFSFPGGDAHTPSVEYVVNNVFSSAEDEADDEEGLDD